MDSDRTPNRWACAAGGFCGAMLTSLLSHWLPLPLSAFFWFATAFLPWAVVNGAPWPRAMLAALAGAGTAGVIMQLFRWH